MSRRDPTPVPSVDPATISRRRSRMHSEGVAWVTAHPAGSATPACALVEITCVPGRSGTVADVLATELVRLPASGFRLPASPSGVVRRRHFTGHDDLIRAWADAIGIPSEP